MTSENIKPDSYRAYMHVKEQSSKCARLFRELLGTLTSGSRQSDGKIWQRMQRAPLRKLELRESQPSWGPSWCIRFWIYLHESSTFAAINPAERPLARQFVIADPPCWKDGVLPLDDLTRLNMASVKWVMTKLDVLSMRSSSHRSFSESRTCLIWIVPRTFKNSWPVYSFSATSHMRLF